MGLDAFIDDDIYEDHSSGEDSEEEFVELIETLTVQSEDNVLYRVKDSQSSRFNLAELSKWLIYDNSFMRRLFPDIKQQKPGIDLYVYVATIQLILLAYVFLFYTNMAGDTVDIATQFSTNELSSSMVVTIIVIIIIICIDRVLYSTHAFLSGAKLTFNEQSGAGPEGASEKNDLKISADTVTNTSTLDADMSMLHRESG